MEIKQNKTFPLTHLLAKNILTCSETQKLPTGVISKNVFLLLPEWGGGSPHGGEFLLGVISPSTVRIDKLGKGVQTNNLQCRHVPGRLELPGRLGLPEARRVPRRL